MNTQQVQRADAHIHLFKQGYQDKYGVGWARQDEVECYDALRQNHQIAKALVVGFEGAPRYAGNNRYLAVLGKKYPWMAPLCYVNCQRCPSLATLRVPFVGIALYVNSPSDAQQLLRWPSRFYDDFNEKRAIISINAAPPILNDLSDFAKRVENCPVLISHLGLPGTFKKAPTVITSAKVLQPLCSLAKSPNVKVKISGLYAMSNPSYNFPHRSTVPLLRHIYDTFGAERLLWGSDFSPCLEHISFAQTIAALEILNEKLQWPESEMQHIRGGNLLSLLDAA